MNDSENVDRLSTLPFKKRAMVRSLPPRRRDGGGRARKPLILRVLMVFSVLPPRRGTADIGHATCRSPPQCTAQSLRAIDGRLATTQSVPYKSRFSVIRKTGPPGALTAFFASESSLDCGDCRFGYSDISLCNPLKGHCSTRCMYTALHSPRKHGRREPRTAASPHCSGAATYGMHRSAKPP